MTDFEIEVLAVLSRIANALEQQGEGAERAQGHDDSDIDQSPSAAAIRQRRRRERQREEGVNGKRDRGRDSVTPKRDTERDMSRPERDPGVTGVTPVTPLARAADLGSLSDSFSNSRGSCSENERKTAREGVTPVTPVTRDMSRPVTRDSELVTRDETVLNNDPFHLPLVGALRKSERLTSEGGSLSLLALQIRSDALKSGWSLERTIASVEHAIDALNIAALKPNAPRTGSAAFIVKVVRRVAQPGALEAEAAKLETKAPTSALGPGEVDLGEYEREFRERQATRAERAAEQLAREEADRAFLAGNRASR